MTFSRIAAAGGLFVAAILFTAPRAHAADQAGKAAVVQGRVEALRDGQWRAMWSEDPIFVGDRIRTFADGRVQIQFVDNSLVRLAANSQLEITQYMFKSTERLGLLRLWTGRLRAVVAKKLANSKNDYKLVTPTAVAGVRGTDLGLSYPEPEPGQPKPETELIVFEGVVDFGGAGGTTPPVAVNGGETSSAGENGPASNPAPASEEQMQQFETASNPREGDTGFADSQGAPHGEGAAEPGDGAPGDGNDAPLPQDSGAATPPPINQIPESRASDKANADVEIRRVP